MGTLIGLFMPAYFPHCARYIEDGANFLNGESIPRLMEISTDGIIKCCRNKDIDSCESHLLLDHFDCIVEIKCPYPNNRNLPVHYDLPVRYVTQILAGMKVKRTLKCLYISYSEESTTFMECKFDSDLWEHLWTETKKTYDYINPLKPSHLDANIGNIKASLQDYISQNVTFICELPSIKGFESDENINYRIKNPYKKGPVHVASEPDFQLIYSDIFEHCNKAKTMTEKSHELSRKKAGEILTFILSDSDREKSQYGIDHIPIAYAMKGYSLKVEIMRKLIEDVRNKCKDEGIDILTEVSDGQWFKIISQDINGQPLTRLQYQKKIWNDVMKMKKKDMIQYLIKICTVTEETLTTWAKQDQILNVDGTHTIGNLMVKFIPAHKIYFNKSSTRNNSS